MPHYYLERKKWFLENYWGKDHDNIFVPNGILSARDLVPKLRILKKLVQRDGRVLDLGCGNGLLLKCLLAASRRKLVPYGVDFIEAAIRQAKDRILPRFRRNFSVGNVLRYRFRTKFDYIITDPECAADRDIGTFCRRCRDGLRKGGALIFFIPDDGLPRLRMRQRTIPYLESQGFRWSRLGGLLCAYATRD